MLIPKETCTILCHSYYSKSVEDLSEDLKSFESILINDSSENRLFSNKSNEEAKLKVIYSPNKGKDIGGKLALIDMYLSMPFRSKYLIFLHDKKSPHSALGKKWRDDLFKIISPDYSEKIINAFSADHSLGLISNKNYIKTEYSRNEKKLLTTNAQLLNELIDIYKINPGNYAFVAGTMFWVRSSIVESFFLKNSPLLIRSALESGNIFDTDTGTYTHAWERVFSWIAPTHNLKIGGI